MKTKFYLSIFVFFLSMVCSFGLYAQGCVSVRNMASCSTLFDSLDSKAWQFSMNYRYFKSFRHYSGSEEHTNRVEENTNVINHDNSVILGISHTINNRWAVSVIVPYVYFDRSSRPRATDDRNVRAATRHYTNAQGLGDIRITGYYSIMPYQQKGNLVVGLGVKLPTGKYNYMDDVYSFATDGTVTYTSRPVDQSIQPGDGGLGVVVEADFSREVFKNGYAYANGSYLFNPRNTNGTKTFRSNPFEDVMSVADQFFLRVGVRYLYKHFQLGVGGRYEGVPVKDAIGKSDGFRRPGYIVSAEPSLFYMSGNHTFGVTVPVALYRNRTQSVADQRLEAQEPSNPQHGDAAFADWLLSISYAYKLSRSF